MVRRLSKPPTSFRKQVMTLIGERCSDTTVVICRMVFVRMLGGDHKAAILLNQILYWSDCTKDPDGWFYKSYAEWEAELALSEAEVRRIINGDPHAPSAQRCLRDLGVETVVRKVKHTGAPTLHYRINQAQFLAALQTFLEQGDPEQSAGLILENAQDEPRDWTGMNTDPNAAPLINSETTFKEESSEEKYHPMPAHHPDEESDFDLFLPFESCFGKCKAPTRAAVQAEVTWLGAPRVRAVLERCAQRGRSWNYVLKALANESPVAVAPHRDAPPEESTGLAREAVAAPVQPQAPPEASLPISGRVQTAWQRQGVLEGTVQDAWSAMYFQLQAQLDRAAFDRTLQHATLVDFEPAPETFIVVVRSEFARDELQGRLERILRRIIRDVYGHPADVRYLLREEWAEEGVPLRAGTEAQLAGP